jgi:DNA-nicking Smr family endonuclease
MRRRLSRDEAQVWARVAQTVKPFKGKVSPPLGEVAARSADGGGSPPKVPLRPAFGGPPPPKGEPLKIAKPRALDRDGLDGSWDKKLVHGLASPDFTLDLHGHSLDAAYLRLEHGLSQALALGARVVLVITGRPRGAEAADRGSRRGAIRAKLLDWLAAGPYAQSIAAVRGAHRRHGGAGAVYVILRRRK